MEDNQKYIMTVVLQVHYDDEFLEDIIIAALEGGSNYWIECIKVRNFENDKPQGIPTSTWIFEKLKNGETIVLYLEDDGRAFLTLSKLKRGVKKYFSDSNNLVGGLTLDAADYDADMADLVLQYSVFDEAVYG